MPALGEVSPLWGGKDENGCRLSAIVSFVRFVAKESARPAVATLPTATPHPTLPMNLSRAVVATEVTRWLGRTPSSRRGLRGSWARFATNWSWSLSRKGRGGQRPNAQESSPLL